ncbi:MAG: DUF4340 domain-containing protein [Planctomycetes bacterium]|jgi:hypothetical protein|nr:DUF4340 domain-containing protein [Planctomycetota bacterium]
MDNRKLGILAVVAAFMVVWAVVQARLASGKRAAPSGPTYLIQGLDPADIGSITIGKGKDPIKLVRQEGRFVVANKADYPADTKQINDLITKSLDIKTADLYTSEAKNHEDLQVTEDKARTVVKFFKADGTLLTGVVVGAARETGSGTFVRLASSDDVYMTEEAPWYRDRAVDFVNQELVAAKREDVNAVTVTTPEGTYTLRSGKGDTVALVNMPADRKLKDSDAQSVLTALTGLRFEDVNTPAQVQGLTFDHEYLLRLNNSTEYRLKLAKKGAKTYLLCEADYMDKTPVMIKPNQQDSQEELKKKEAKLLAQEHAQKFTLQHKGWIYDIAEWKAKYLTMKQADLLEEPAKPAEKPAAAPAPGAAAAPAATPAPAPSQPQAVPAAPVAAPKPAAEPNKPAALPAPATTPAAAEPK